MELGKAQPNLPHTYYYYCCEHFDKKYKSERDRRTRLLGEAVPYAHDSVPIDHHEDVVHSEEYAAAEMSNELYVYEDMNNFECTMAVNQDQVESTTMTDDAVLNELVENSIHSDDDLLHINKTNVCETKTFIKSHQKRKATTAISAASSSTSNVKIIQALTISQPPSADNNPILLKSVSPIASDNAKFRRVDLPANDVDQSREDQKPNIHLEEVSYKPMIEEDQAIDPESLVDSKHTTVFIFKGEAYLQMPKDFYIKEKIELLTKLQNLESVIEGIKEILVKL